MSHEHGAHPTKTFEIGAALNLAFVVVEPA
jgi:hypothetical protein